MQFRTARFGVPFLLLLGLGNVGCSDENVHDPVSVDEDDVAPETDKSDINGGSSFRSDGSGVATLSTDWGEGEIAYEILDGVAIAEGDIEVPGVVDVSLAGKTSTSSRWGGGRVPYTVSSDLPDQERITAAIAEWAAKTKIRLVPRTNESDYVEFRSSTLCSSSIGKVGGRQYVNLSTGESSSSVAAVAIDHRDDKVTYFYKRGFATTGTTTSAAATRAHFKVTYPAGKSAADLVETTFGASDRVYAFYKDGTVSEGTSTNLSSVKAPAPLTLRAGKSMTDVLAIGMDASAKTYTYWRDGVYTVGTSTNLVGTAAPVAFTVPSGKLVTNLANVDISKNGTFYAFYTDGRKSSGSAAALAANDGTTPGNALPRVSYPGTCTTGATIHEIGHAIGLFHEHVRSDRDAFVVVHSENIESGKEGNFTKNGIFSSSKNYGAYDFGSIMHYGSYSFSKNGQPTITKKDGSTFDANRTALSALDVTGVASMYP